MAGQAVVQLLDPARLQITALACQDLHSACGECALHMAPCAGIALALQLQMPLQT